MSGPERPAPGQISTLLRELVHAPETELGGGWESVLRTGAVIGRFELLREVARGGFGVVWEARDRDLGRTVAFKALRGGTRPTVLEQRYLLEAEAAARCSHPNIVTLFDVGRTQHGPYLVLELLQGQTLAARLRRGPMSPGEALRIAVEVAKGLAHAHAQGIVHRDLTPRNVFLCNDGQVKVLDLGMAHVFGRPLVEGGTPGYMAPEQRRGAPEDERTDVYALAAVLCHMLGGELRERVEENDGPVHALPTGAVEPALEALIGRMLELDPVARPRDAGEVLAALTALQRSRTDGNVDRDANASRGRPPQARAIRARRRRWRRAWLLGGAGALLVAALAVWRLQPRVRAPENPLASARFVMLTDFDGIEQAAAISRDGRFVAFQSDRDGQMDVWVTQVGTGHFSNLTRGSAPEIVNPSLRTLGFSPDGTLVTYWARRRDGGKQSEISVWAAPLLGGHARPYLDGIAEYDWTNDGARLVYHTPGPGDPMYVRDSWPVGSAPDLFGTSGAARPLPPLVPRSSVHLLRPGFTAGSPGHLAHQANRRHIGEAHPSRLGRDAPSVHERSDAALPRHRREWCRSLDLWPRRRGPHDPTHQLRGRQLHLPGGERRRPAYRCDDGEPEGHALARAVERQEGRDVGRPSNRPDHRQRIAPEAGPGLPALRVFQRRQ